MSAGDSVARSGRRVSRFSEGLGPFGRGFHEARRYWAEVIVLLFLRLFVNSPQSGVEKSCLSARAAEALDSDTTRFRLKASLSRG
jgi:hypothetical protein